MQVIDRLLDERRSLAQPDSCRPGENSDVTSRTSGGSGASSWSPAGWRP